MLVKTIEDVLVAHYHPIAISIETGGVLKESAGKVANIVPKGIEYEDAGNIQHIHMIAGANFQLRGIAKASFASIEPPKHSLDPGKSVHLHNTGVLRVADKKVPQSGEGNVGGIAKALIRIVILTRREGSHETQRPVKTLYAMVSVVGDKDVDTVARPEARGRIKLIILPPGSANLAHEQRVAHILPEGALLSIKNKEVAVDVNIQTVATNTRAWLRQIVLAGKQENPRPWQETI
jgi:hypothetical protein